MSSEPDFVHRLSSEVSGIAMAAAGFGQPDAAGLPEPMKLLTRIWPLAVASLVACGGGGGATNSTDAPVSGIAGTIASGQLAVPAATSFGEPGFHQGFLLEHTLPPELSARAGARLILRLWDADRPEQTCDQEHPISGCVTVDWSDAIGRPNVPDDGIFDNRLTLELVGGSHDFYLTEKRGLADTPDPYVPS